MKWFATQIALGVLWCGKRLVQSFISNWPIIFKANLYFWGAFLAGLGEKLCAILFLDQWPSVPYACGSLLAALVVSSIALRAFYDGAAQRHQDAHANDSSQTVTRTDVQQTTVVTDTQKP